MRTGLIPPHVGPLLLSLIAIPLAVVAENSPNPAPAPARAAGPKVSFEGQVVPILAKYCNSCHGGDRPKAGLNLANVRDPSAVAKNRKVWEHVIEYVEAGEMPPEGKPRPSSTESEALVNWINAQLSSFDCRRLNDPGRITIRRLNRSEYDNTIRDLIGIDFQAAEDFPSDDVGYGFDNIGDVLSLPPILMEQYLAAAEKIAGQAILAGPSTFLASKTYETEELGDSAGGGRFNDWGRILASAGEISVHHLFPRNGEYLLKVRAFGQQAGSEPAKMEFRIDGKAIRVFDVNAEESKPATYEYRAKLKAGNRRLSAAFVNDYYDEKNPDEKRRDRNLVVDSIEVVGPFYSKSDPLPESHRRILFCRPSTTLNKQECARRILERFASRAFRRPATAGEVARLVKFVDLAQQNGDSFERGIQLAVQAVLVSPAFLYRVELDYQPSREGSSYLINDFELASRLSYFLWSSMPDDELWQLALHGKLRSGDTLDRQVKRMLADPRSKALVANFAGQWLQIRNLKTVNPDRGRFKSFDDNLRADMAEETERFFGAIVHENRSILEFIDADYTFLNERLAKHYGIDSVKGEKFQRVSLRDSPRGGLITQASILTVTSNPTRTSPVKRGKWILEQILGTPPPPPPPNVPELKENAEVDKSASLRKRMEQHRSDPACASCHARMDPLGFGLENFDAVGAWRDKDGEFPIDPSGTLPSGQQFQGPKELKAIIKSREKDFTRCLTEKLLTYALGRGMEYYDKCSVDKIVENVSANQHRFARLVLEIVKSDPFQKRKGKGD